MSFFHSEVLNETCGVVVDIGSGSVGVAIVTSVQDTDQYEVIWSHREHMLIKDVTDEKALQKDIQTTIVNAFLELGGSGMTTLRSMEKPLKIHSLQVAVSAPWAFTVTKNIHFEDEITFIVTKKIIEDLIATATNDTSNVFDEQALVQSIDLEKIAETTVRVQLNGYDTKHPIGNSAHSIDLSHISQLVQNHIPPLITQLQEKILPKTTASSYSFMYMYYQVLRHLHPDTTEVCLVDITNEATEIGIVRDDVLLFVTHIPVGMYSLARELSIICNISKEEAYAVLKNGADITALYGEKNAEKIEALYTVYQEQIAELFMHTADSLSIPSTLFLHTSKNTEDFFGYHIKKAAENCTKNTHFVHNFTSQILGKRSLEDTALAVSIHYFHKKSTYRALELQ